MSLSVFETPDYGRAGSQSALDFTYWALTYAENAFDKTTLFPPFEGTEESGLAMMQVITFCCEQVEVYCPPTVDALRDRALAKGTTITVAQALLDRGALLFRNAGVVITLGDRRRIIEPFEDGYVVRHLSTQEKMESYWEAARIPGMIYL